MSLVYLNLFNYEFVEHAEQNTVYRNCVVLRKFGIYEPGQIIDAITIYLTLYIWEGDEMVNDVVVLI